MASRRECRNMVRLVGYSDDEEDDESHLTELEEDEEMSHDSWDGNDAEVAAPPQPSSSPEPEFFDPYGAFQDKAAQNRQRSRAARDVSESPDSGEHFVPSPNPKRNRRGESPTLPHHLP